MVDDAPLIRRVGAVGAAVPPAVGGADPAGTLLRRAPGAHELRRGRVQFFDPDGAAAPIRELKVGFVHNGLPVAAPFQAQAHADRPNALKKPTGFIIGALAIVTENVKCYAPLMVGTVAAAGGVRDDGAGLDAALGVEGVLLCHGAQGFANLDF